MNRLALFNSGGQQQPLRGCAGGEKFSFTCLFSLNFVALGRCEFKAFSPTAVDVLSCGMFSEQNRRSPRSSGPEMRTRS